MKTTANGTTAAQVQCTNEKCEFYWICNNMMSETAIIDEEWCNKPGKHLTK